MYLFTGYRDHRVDGKDRIVIPAPIATAVTATGRGLLVLVPGSDGPFLEAYPGDVFEAMAREQVPNRFAGELPRKRAFFGNAEQCELRGPGRIAIPKRWLGLFPDRVVRVVGMNTYLELWDPGRWEEHVGSGVRGAGGGTPPTA